MIKIIFFGNTKYSNIGLEIVSSAYPVSLVVTFPDSPVKLLSKQLNVPCAQTRQIDEKIISDITNLKPDFLVVEDFGLILPKALLDIPKYAPLNIHHSLLPKYRGPSPAPTAILNGDPISGVSIIRIIETVDAGPILAQQKYQLKPDETTQSLLTKLNQIGAGLLIKVIKTYLEGSAKPVPQDESKATQTGKLTRQDGFLEIDHPPSLEKLDRMVRAYFPWPGVWTKWSPNRHPERSAKDLKIVKFLPGGLVQMEGKKPVSFEEFLRGYPDFPVKELVSV